jgi:DNA-directed RNA polymerase specialized sigma24 family protein
MMLLALDKEEKNSNRKHRRRLPTSFESMDYQGQWFSAGIDLLDEMIQAEDREWLIAALAKLTQQQQALVERVYVKNEKIK